jgi:hypothetical protein
MTSFRVTPDDNKIIVFNNGNSKGFIPCIPKGGHCAYGTVITIILAIIFTFFQGVEYSVSSFTISDSVYGSTYNNV